MEINTIFHLFGKVKIDVNILKLINESLLYWISPQIYEENKINEQETYVLIYISR